jgi:RHS repeat-associated protein
MVRAYDTGGIGGNADRKLLKFDAFNKPTRIQNSGLDQNLEDNGHVLEFSYGSNGQRFYQLKGDAPGQGSGYVGDEYKIYIDKMMEITGDINDTQDSGAKLYIGDYAVYDISTDLALARSQAKLQYLYRDRLGSVVAIADSNGDLVETAGRGFDPFGKPREDDWSDSDHRNNGLNDQGDTADIPGDLNRDDLTTRGFTGHEHLNETDLIHMNGRVYDYNLGRFYSVDPFIQFPENSQSVNGYSYILNNPLSGTDPSGYQSNSDVDTQTAAGSSSGGNSAMDQAKEAAADSIVEVRITHKRGTTGCRTCKGEVTGITAKYGSGLSVSVSGRKGGFQINGVSLTPNIHQSGKKGESSEIGSVEDRKLVSKDVEFGKSEIDPKTMLARSSSGTSTVAGTTSKTLKKNNLSIRGSAEFKSKVAQVEAKAKQAGLTIFDDLRNGPVEVIIMEVTGDSVFAMYKNRKTKADVPVVEWNPALAMKVRYASVGRDQYAYQSAALGLVHELGHAHQYSIQSLRGDLPESPVINGWEKQWAEFFGEKTRHPSYLHGGENRKTNDIFWFSK